MKSEKGNAYDRRTSGRPTSSKESIVNNKSRVLNKIPPGINGGKSVDKILGKRKVGPS